jgi:hypothetical protein
MTRKLKEIGRITVGSMHEDPLAFFEFLNSKRILVTKSATREN